MFITKKNYFGFLISLALLYSSFSFAITVKNCEIFTYWDKQGDFSQIVKGDFPLKHHVKYLIASTNSIVKSVEINGYKNGEFMVVVTPVSKKGYDLLLKQKNTAGFPEISVVDSVLQRLSFTSASLEELHLFINTMVQAEPKLKEIENELYAALHINPDSVLVPLNPWLKTGDFSQIVDGDFPLKRQVTYSSTSPDNVVKEIELLGYKDGDFRIVVTPRSKEGYDLLSKENSAAGFPESSIIDSVLQRLSFTSASLEELHLFINTMVQAEPKLKEIEDELLAACRLQLLGGRHRHKIVIPSSDSVNMTRM